MNFKKQILLFLYFLVVAQTLDAQQWFYDDMGSTNTGSAPSTWINTSSACNPPGVTNQGVTITGQVGAPTWFGGWDGTSTSTTSNGGCLTWQSQTGQNGNTSVTYTYTLMVTGTATISSMTFGMRRNSLANPNLAVTINGTPYTPVPTTMGTTSWFPVSVTVSPAVTVTNGTLTIAIGFTGQTSSTSGGMIQRMDELRIFGSTMALPVELVKFDAKSIEKDIHLHWATASEINNEKFEIEESQNGREFQKIAEVKGNGTTIERQDYSFKVENPQVGILYYRLKQVDFDGGYEYSKVVSVLRENDKFDVISVSPNPTNDVINIVFETQNDDDLAINLLDIFGKTIKQLTTITTERGINNQALDLQDLPNGIYFLQLQQGTERIIRKVVKE